MFTVHDTKGRLTSLLCFLLLLSYHTSRDALITSLHNIAHCHNTTDDESPNTSGTTGTRTLLSGVNIGSINEDNTIWAADERRNEDSRNGIESDNEESTLWYPWEVNFMEKNLSSTSPAAAPSSLSDYTTSLENNNTYFKNNNNIDYNKILIDIVADILAEKKSLASRRTKRSANSGDLIDHNSDDTMPGPLRHANMLLLRNKLETAPKRKRQEYDEPYNADEAVRCDVTTPFGDWLYQYQWDLPIQGSVLSAFHWMTVFGLLLGHYCIELSKVRDGVVTALFVFLWAMLSLVTPFTAQWGPMALLALRAWQGLVQGACYPCIYRLLESRGVHGRLYLALIFSGPWCGTAMGTSLGSLSYIWPVPFYISGSVATIVAVVLLFLAQGTKATKPAVQCSWRVVIQRDVVVSALIHAGSVWVYHTLMIVPTQVLQPKDRWWVLLSMITAGAVTTQLLECAVDYFVPYKSQPARGHLLTSTVLGFAMSIVSLVMLAVEVQREETNQPRTIIYVLLACIMGMIFSVGVTSVGYRQVLEVAAEHRKSRALVCVNGAGSLGAAIASLLIPTMAINKGSFMSGCLLPLSMVITAVVCVFIFLLFPTNTEDETDQAPKPERDVYVIPMSNGAVPGRTTDANSIRSVDDKSFKSVMSNTSFKTAVSRHNSRTTSFNTVIEDGDVDMYSIMDEYSVDYRSVILDDDGNSVRSMATSYRSARHQDPNAEPQQPSFSDLPQNEGDRTSAWLHLHHQVDMNHWTPAADTRAVKPRPLPGLLR